MAPRTSSHLERGRAAYERCDWADAREALLAARREAPLSAADTERLAWAGGYLANDEELIAGLERARELYAEVGEWERAALCAFWAGNRLTNLGELGRGSAFLARADRLVAEVGGPCAAEGYLLLPVAFRKLGAHELDEGEKLALRSLEIAERFRDRNLEALAQSLLGRVLLRRGDVERGLVALDLSVHSASSAGTPPIVSGLVLCAAIAHCSRVFALDRAREWTAALTRFCEAQPQLVQFSSTCLIHCSEVHQASGDWPRALADAERAADVLPKPPAVHHGPHGPALYQQAELKRVQGELDDAEALYGAASDKGSEPQPGLALLRLVQGKTDVAAVAMRRVLAATTDAQSRIRLLPAGVEIFLAEGKIDEAGELAVELERAANQLQTPALRAMAAHARGSVSLAEGNLEGALPPLRRAFETWQEVGAPYLAARVRSELCAAYRALGDLDGAELERRAAAAVFDRLGARLDRAKLDDAPAAERPGGLSARELTVLKLVAEGKTNKVIAVELSLSEKTVDRHVSNIFGKLNVSSRAAATAFAYQHGLT
jgi:ATP/maltotriose-dependent transcriptional regulator MalT